MSINMKIWITLAILFPIAFGVAWIDEGDTVISDIAITEMLSFFAFSVGMAIDIVWSM